MLIHIGQPAERVWQAVLLNAANRLLQLAGQRLGRHGNLIPAPLVAEGRHQANPTFCAGQKQFQRTAAAYRLHKILAKYDPLLHMVALLLEQAQNAVPHEIGSERLPPAGLAV